MTITLDGTLGVTTPAETITGTLAVTGITTVAAGSAAAPSIVSTTGTADTGQFFPAADTVAFSTAGTERMRIGSTGLVGIGTTTGVTKLDVVTSTDISVIAARSPASYTNPIYFATSVTAASTAWYYFYGTSSTNTVVNIAIFGNGNVQNTNNSYGAISDIKLKENIVDATPKLEQLNRVRVVNFNLKSSPEQKQLGVIAQELENIFPGMVDEINDRDADGNVLETKTKSVKYSVFVPMLIKAMQEQQAIIETLTARISALETK
jgi:hypothetical protein